MTPDLKTVAASLIDIPIGIPRNLMGRIDSPMAKALNAMTAGAMSLDEKRRIVRQAQIDNINRK